MGNWIFWDDVEIQAKETVSWGRCDLWGWDLNLSSVRDGVTLALRFGEIYEGGTGRFWGIGFFGMTWRYKQKSQSRGGVVTYGDGI